MFQSLFRGRSKETANVRQGNAGELWDEMQSDTSPLLIDVRSAQEFENDGHINGARLLPLQTLTTRHGELPKDQPIVCVCRSGNRSQI